MRKYTDDRKHVVNLYRLFPRQLQHIHPESRCLENRAFMKEFMPNAKSLECKIWGWLSEIEQVDDVMWQRFQKFK